MIQTEYLNEGTLIRHYSDIGMMMLQNETGVKYADAVDVVPCAYTYTETNESAESIEWTEEDNEEITGDEFLAMVKEAL